ncbi:hypothetical protein AB1Y20_007195 [Prymnesium parvum]|uniref:Uncharacterized protein n=1 Tax=Prymnesium parvum TaxID=97485 RepID=A0AB34IXZ0_PRYPA
MPCPSVHAAFYLWYGTPAFDGEWRHWDHPTLPHWDARVRARFPPPGVRATPPDKPHSPFYPDAGPYSSSDNATLRRQLSSLAAAGVDSVMLSWWGRADAAVTRDTQGVSTDERVGAVLAAAAEAGVSVSWHLEPYGGRSPSSVALDLEYLHRTYGAHPAVWRQGGRPLVFLYDVSASHAPPHAAEWRQALGGVRRTAADAVLLSLYLDERDVRFVEEAGFDGVYTYFAADGFTQGSTPSHWPAARRRLAAAGKLFFPSVGPGYNDTLIRPWNGANSRPRRGGAYYDSMWRRALEVQPEGVTITSFNEWGEGTQIEPAAPHTAADGSVYDDYGEGGAAMYMEKTAEWRREARRACGAQLDEL